MLCFASNACNANNNGNANYNGASNVERVAPITTPCIPVLEDRSKEGSKESTTIEKISRKFDPLMQPSTEDVAVSGGLYFISQMSVLNACYYKAAKVSSWKYGTQLYGDNLLSNNFKLQKDLREKTYKELEPRNFTINERGKVRKIQSPRIRDRVVQKALNQYVLPVIRRHLIYDNGASLKGKGTDFTRKRLKIHLQKALSLWGADFYVLKIDIKKYFDSIDHEVLIQMLKSIIPDESLWWLFEESLGQGRGISLGSEMPQTYAIYYLNSLDQFCKTVKGLKFYVRYMDDIIILYKSKEYLTSLLYEIKNVLKKINLKVNEKKTFITPMRHGFTYMQVQYLLDKDNKLYLKSSASKISRIRRRLKKEHKLVVTGKISLEDWKNAYLSSRGSLKKLCSCKRSLQHLDNFYEDLASSVTDLADAS